MKENSFLEAKSFFDLKSQTSEYQQIYKSPCFDSFYPANAKRLEIFVSMLKTIQAKVLLDVGCGNALPMIEFLKEGYRCEGFDAAPNMVNEAKSNLSDAGYNPDLVWQGDFDELGSIEDQYYDCILGMGSLYYSRDTAKLVSRLSEKVKTNGYMIFSLRNRLFDLVSCNTYTKRFLLELYNATGALEEKVSQVLDRCFEGGANKNSIDSQGVFSQVHNPLTVESELLQPSGLKLLSTQFYHFHAGPPSLEIGFPGEFRKLSWEQENPTDWRGYFLASGFVVLAQKVDF